MAIRRLGMYDHLNHTDKVVVELNMDKLAELVEKSNYGTHRFLSALVRFRRHRKDIDRDSDGKMLTDAIETALERGGY